MERVAGGMIKRAASKVMWVGRATVFLVGLAVIVGLAVGVASTALGANGTAWLLGRNNTATITTQLGGASGANDPMLDITDNNAGTDDTALSLNVQSGEPPMKVNSDTRVANFNSDKIDGQEASAFLGTNQKAADSDKLDGLDSADFGKAYKRTVVVSPVGTGTQNGQALLNALSSITDASATKPYLLHIEPATYELGTAS
jgi:hypothetical protein